MPSPCRRTRKTRARLPDVFSFSRRFGGSRAGGNDSTRGRPGAAQAGIRLRGPRLRLVGRREPRGPARGTSSRPAPHRTFLPAPRHTRFGQERQGPRLPIATPTTTGTCAGAARSNFRSISTSDAWAGARGPRRAAWATVNTGRPRRMNDTTGTMARASPPSSALPRPGPRAPRSREGVARTGVPRTPRCARRGDGDGAHRDEWMPSIPASGAGSDLAHVRRADRRGETSARRGTYQAASPPSARRPEGAPNSRGTPFVRWEETASAA